MSKPIQAEPENVSQTALTANGESKAEQGYGACSSSGCNCQSYAGSADTCSNCGHNYATHW
jgi:hypothetical protein